MGVCYAESKNTELHNQKQYKRNTKKGHDINVSEKQNQKFCASDFQLIQFKSAESDVVQRKVRKREGGGRQLYTEDNICLAETTKERRDNHVEFTKTRVDIVNEQLRSKVKEKEGQFELESHSLMEYLASKKKGADEVSEKNEKPIGAEGAEVEQGNGKIKAQWEEHESKLERMITIIGNGLQSKKKSKKR